MLELTRLRRVIAIAVLGTFLIFSYTNCSNKVAFKATSASSESSSLGVQSYSSQFTVSASKPNAPLDLFFVVDNSASMLGHQINLAAAFQSIFQNNATTLSNFDTRIFLFSTASTLNKSYLLNVPTTSPFSLSSVPAPSDTANLQNVPGSIFGFWNSATGVYNTAPYIEQFLPAPVSDFASSSGSVQPSLFIAKKGSQSNAQYNASIAAVTGDFQHRLAYLNPTNQLALGNLTDISSGLCSMSRILRHSSSFIQPGDSAAFIVVSDDNDRLNTRNPNGNECTESIIGSQTVIDGSCGHYETNYSFQTSANVSYQSDSKFNYPSGTNISYSYPSSEDCTIQYQTGYNYTWTYTLLQTDVTYNKCTQFFDGTCITQSPVTTTINGSYAGSGNSCSQNMASLVSSPAPGTTYSCVANSLANQIGSPGVDTVSQGSACSSTLLSNLNSNPLISNISCTIGSKNIISTNITNQPIGSCINYCSSSSLKGCAYVSKVIKNTNATLALSTNGLTCSSSCPNSESAVCGTGTISAFLQTNYGATCNTASVASSAIVVNSAHDSSGAPLTCNSALTGFTVKNSKGAIVCASASKVSDCTNSLQQGTQGACTVATPDHATLSASVDITCSTPCANSNGFCDPSKYATVKDEISTKLNGLCLSTSNAGTAHTKFIFQPSLAQNADCSSKCSDTQSGACDSQGFGATDGSTISDFIKAKLNGSATCSSQTNVVSDTAVQAYDSTTVAAACRSNASPVFIASDAAHPAVATNYVAGDSRHLASDIENYISTQAKAVFGANNPVAVAVITQLPGDNLFGTSVGQDYIDLASLMNSSQVTSITGSYSAALSQISNFIVNTTQNNFVLPIPQTDIVYAVSALKQGSSTWVTVDPSLWTWSGQTLSVNSSAGLKIGDQLMYTYHN